MDILDKAYDRACCELDDMLQKQKFDSQDVDNFGKFIDIVKDIEKVWMSQDNETYGDNRGYSGRSMPEYSYARSRRNGYSRDNRKMMLDHLQDIADMAVDEKDRKAVEKLMSQMMNQN